MLSIWAMAHLHLVSTREATRASLVARLVKNLPTVQETRVQSLGWEDPLEKEMATHSSILAWKISWTEEPGGLQSMGSQRVGHDWVTYIKYAVTAYLNKWNLKSNSSVQQPHFKCLITTYSQWLPYSVPKYVTIPLMQCVFLDQIPSLNCKNQIYKTQIWIQLAHYIILYEH